MPKKNLNRSKKSEQKPYKELPGHHLPNEEGMHLYGGYIMSKPLQGDNDSDNECSEYRFRLYVPTTIFDYKRAVIKVYHMESALHQTPEVPEEVVATEYVHLNSLPHWDRSYQALMLGSRDQRKVISVSKSLEKRLGVE